jgi:hypothetical protein
MESLSDLLPEGDALNQTALYLISIVDMDIEENEKSDKMKEAFNSLGMEAQLEVWELIRVKGIEFGSHHKKMTSIIKEYLRMKPENLYGSLSND